MVVIDPAERGDIPSLRAQGFDFYDWAANEARLVVSWDQDPADIDRLSAAIASL